MKHLIKGSKFARTNSNETPEVRDKRLQILRVNHKVRETPEVRYKRIQIFRERIQNKTPILHL